MTMTAGPDQGFAWGIALACFCINFIMAGLARTTGVLYVALINLYGVSREEATTPFSIRVCVRNMTGPLIGLLGQKYGIRGITAIGAFIAGLGSIFCSFAPNIFWITIFWGVIHGLGFGLGTVLHMMVIGQYFSKYKASALGLAYSGDCFGTFAFPSIMETLLTKYGIKGTFLIVGGMVLNVIPMALLLRKPQWYKEKEKQRALEGQDKSRTIQLMRNNTITNLKRSVADKSSQTNLEGLNKKEDERLTEIDDLPFYENVVNAKKFPSSRQHMLGHNNPAFISSDSDSSSLNEPIEMKISNINSSKNSLNKYSSKNSLNIAEAKDSETESLQANNLALNRHKLFSTLSIPTSIPASKSTIGFSKASRPDDLQSSLNIRKIRSVSDLNFRNDSFSHLNKSPWLNRIRNVDIFDRRESLPKVLEKETNQKNELKIEKSADVQEHNKIWDMEAPRCEGIGGFKRRTSSFVGQVALEIVNRMRTASFASQIAQDAFCTPIAQIEESDSEHELDCELKSVVEHKENIVDNCINKDLILSVDKHMVDDYFKESPDIPEKKIEEKPKPPSVWKVLFRTNTKPMFILICVSMAVYAFVFVGVLTIIIDYGIDQGISNEQGKYLIIGFSVADLFGRLGFGQVIDRNLMKMKNYSGCTMVIMGAVVAAVPLNTSFNYIMVCMCMYGLFQGGAAIMFPILINMYMDRNSESVAMGCVNFYGGILILAMAPMIGFYRDNIGSYNGVFYIIGGAVAVVGVAWQFEPMIVKYQNRKLREKYIMKQIGFELENR